MILDKTLLLKGVAGVAALGGIGGGTYIYREELGIVSSSKKATDVQDLTSVDNKGIPNRCTSSPCELTEDELKKIKFETLGDDGATAVAVEGFPAGDQKLTLTIDSTDTTKKKYIFSNGSSGNVTIKRGNDKVVTLDNTKKTKFSLSSDKLKQFTLDDYGIPSDCTSGCTLTSTDLEDIKFDGLDGALTVEPTNQTVSLSVESAGSEKRFTFTSASQTITIKKDTSSSVTLDASTKTRFKGDNNKLKKIVLGSYGLPSDCTQSCTLTPEDLKEVKFPGFAEKNGNVTVSSSDKTVTYSKDSTKKEYSFQNSSDTITITKDSETITLIGNQTTKFYEENSKLVKAATNDELNKKIKEAGFPTEETECNGSDENKCCKLEDNQESVECKLTKDKFKKLKFSNLGDGEMNDSSLGIQDNNPVTAKIEKDGNGLKITFTGISSNITVSKNGGSDSITVENNSQFTINSQNKIEKKNPS